MTTAPPKIPVPAPPPPQLARWISIPIAVALVLAATVIRLVLLQPLGMRAAYVTFYPAVILAALLGGLRGGLLATALSALIADYFWIDPIHSLGIRDPADWLGLAIFVLSGILISGITGAMRRAQDRAVAAAALRDSQSRMRGIVDTAVDGIITIDENGRIESVNPAALKLFGFTAAELLGQNVSILMPEPQRSGHNGYIERYKTTGQRQIIGSGREVVGQKKDGTTFPLHLGISEVLLGQRRIFTGIVRDLTAARQGEAALRESQQHHEFLAGLISTSSQPLGVGYPDGRLGLVNHAFEELTGYTADELRALDWSTALTPPEWRPMEAAQLGELHRTRRPVRYEKEYLRKDGTRVPIELLVHLVADSGGQPQYYYSFITDITHRKQTEQALRQSQFLYRSLFQNMLDGFAYCQMLYDDRGRPADFVYLEVNEAFGKLTGLSHVVGRKVTDVLPGIRQTKPQLLEIYGRVAQTGRPERFEIDFTALLGVWLSVAVYSPQRGYFVAVFEDITQRKRAEEQTHLHLSILESAANAIVITAPDGTIQWVNPAFTQLTGYTAAEAVGQNPRVLKSDRQEPAFFTQLWQTITAGDVWQGQLVNRRKDGSLYTEEMTITPVTNAAHQITHFIAIKQDITARKRAEDERKIAIEFLGLVNASTSTRDLIHASVMFFRQQSLCEAVGIRLRDGDDYPYFETHGFPPQFVQLENSLCIRDHAGAIRRDPAGNPLLECMCGNIICGRFDPTQPFFSPHGSFWSNCTTDLLATTTPEERQAQSRNRCNGQGYESVALLPLRVGDERFGLLQLNDHRKNMFTPETITLWERLAGYLAVALAKAKAEEALRISQERYHSLFSTLLEGFCIIEVLFDDRQKAIDYRFLEINPAFERQTGLRDAVGKRMRELAANHEEHWFEIYGQVALTGQSVRFINEAKALNRWYDVSAYRVGGEGSRKVAILFNDITERKRVENDLKSASISAEHAKAAAEDANRAKDHFLAVLSHELRTPLAPVVVSVSMLLQDPRLDPDTRDNLEMIRRNVELETRLIDDLLDVTRIERGKVELDRQPVELATILRRAAEVCTPDIEARKLEFRVDLGPEAPYLIFADAARLQQVIWNLLKNAIKFTPKGGTISLCCFREHDHVRVEVRDSGVGIEPHVLPRLFNAFEQGDRRITRQFGGLGLGLAISKALAEMHGGTLTAASPGHGRGATFILRLPLLPALKSAISNSEILTPAAPTPPVCLRILLVEDHGDTARVMHRLLSVEGHQVHSAADVATALRLAQEQPFDLLLSDLGLPDGSGLDLLHQLRAQGHTFPAIALSGFGRDQDIQQSRAAGFLTHLTKPVSLPKLADALAKVIHSRPT